MEDNVEYGVFSGIDGVLIQGGFASHDSAEDFIDEWGLVDCDAYVDSYEVVHCLQGK